MANKWAVAIAVMLPTFMEIMDTSVVNVSLPHIQGSLNAGLDEVTWVLTSYLVSNAVIIPISGWLSGVFGRKRYLLFSVFLFVGTSILCGAATSLEPSCGGASHSGNRRRRPSALVSSHFTGILSTGRTWPRHGIFRHGRGPGPHYGSGIGRLDHGSLELALDLLHQFPHGHTGRDSDRFSD